MFRVSEIFGSIEGEGPDSGSLTTFVRLFGCNLSCAYCDSQYACTGHDFTSMSLEAVLSRVMAINYPRITITGGEPLIYGDQLSILLDRLIAGGYAVNVETNGSLPIGQVRRAGVTVSMDVKTPSSGMESKLLPDNLCRIRQTDVLKFVMDCTDEAFVKEFLIANKPDCWIYLSPIQGVYSLDRLAAFMSTLPKYVELRGQLPKIRMQAQFHKVIWPDRDRGV